MEGMEIRNIILERGDQVKTNTQEERDDEVTFIGIFPNNTVYLAWDMYFGKKLFIDEEEIVCVKKVNVNKRIYEI